MVRGMTAIVAAANRGIGYDGSMVRDDGISCDFVRNDDQDQDVYYRTIFLSQQLITLSAMVPARGHEAL